MLNLWPLDIHGIIVFPVILSHQFLLECIARHLLSGQFLRQVTLSYSIVPTFSIRLIDMLIEYDTSKFLRSSGAQANGR